MKLKLIADEVNVTTADQYRVVVETEVTKDQVRKAMWRTFNENPWLWDWARKGLVKRGEWDEQLTDL